MKKIVMLPLDERPCNAKFPVKLFDHDDLRIVMPERLGDKKQPADITELISFLKRECSDADGLVLSMDMLLYGGLIPSRLHFETAETLQKRMEILYTLRQENPALKIYASQCVMRCPSYSSSDEEPDYYEECGKEIHDLGVAVHKSRVGIADPESVTACAAKVPSEFITDYLHRREVNRTLNMKTLDLVLDGTIDALVIPQDDSSPYGYAALDQKVIRSRIAETGLERRVLIYPGADEVGLTLLSRMLIDMFREKKPNVYIRYASELSKQLIPKYEGNSLDATLHSHILSAGCRVTESEDKADIVLMISAPAFTMEEADSQPSQQPGYCVERNLPGLLDAMEGFLEDGKIVTMADNAYCNGADLSLVRLMNSSNLLMRVHGFAGWNTSANTVGTALAEAVDALLFGRTPSHEHFLALRYVEDAGYCSCARGSVTSELPEGMSYFNVEEKRGIAAEMIHAKLDTFCATYLSSIADSIEIRDVAMPWRRMFEVDIDVAYHPEGK